MTIIWELAGPVNTPQRCSAMKFDDSVGMHRATSQSGFGFRHKHDNSLDCYESVAHLSKTLAMLVGNGSRRNNPLILPYLLVHAFSSL